ncbi:MAG: hypothetical protein HYT79_00030 [Elusimicrobia bacterium]|nr:hypothetical protein [Elusimicrobiota bacterium]
MDTGVSVKGYMAHPQIGMEYRFEGKWLHSPRWGETFAFANYSQSYPTSLDAIRSYLKENAKWVGPEISKRIIEAFDKDSLAVLKDNPERVAREISGITPSRAEEISAMLKKIESQEKLELALTEILTGVPVSGRVRHRIIELWGADAPEKLRQNPYELIDKVQGVGFLTADQIARKVGFEPEGYPRIRAGVLYTLKEAAGSGGHTFLPAEMLLVKAQENLNVKVEKISSALAQMKQDGDIVIEGEAVYMRALHRDETAIAKLLKKLRS